MASCQRLELDSNQIGDVGLSALAEACAKGALPKLEELWLHENEIGDVGMQALAGAVSKGAMDKVTIIELSSNRIGDDGMKAFADAVEKGELASLKELYLFQDAPPCLEGCVSGSWHHILLNMPAAPMA